MANVENDLNVLQNETTSLNYQIAEIVSNLTEIQETVANYAQSIGIDYVFNSTGMNRLRRVSKPSSKSRGWCLKNLVYLFM